MRLLWDCETDGLLKEVSKIHCIVAYDLDTDEVHKFRPHQIADGLRLLEQADYRSGHNIFGYDNLVVRKLYPETDLSRGKEIDTLVASRLIFSNMKDRDFIRLNKPDPWDFPKHLIGTHSLEAWGRRLGCFKGDYSKSMKERGLDPWAEFSEEMLDYCEQDVHLNVRLLRMMAAKKPDPRSLELEMEVAKIIIEQEHNGFPFDEKKAAILYAQLSQRRTELTEACAALFPAWYVPTGVMTPKANRRVKRPDLGFITVTPISPKTGKPLKTRTEPLCEEYTQGHPYTKIVLHSFNPSSRQDVADRLQKLYGWSPSEFTDGGQPKIDDDILAALPYEPCKLLGEFYMVEKRIAALAEGKQAWLAKVKADGRIHGRMNPNGAVTGRGIHMDPNIGQVPSVKNAKGIVPYGRECRDLFHAAPGMVLLGVDASGLELRCLGHYMAKYDGGEYIELVVNGDVHTANKDAAGLASRELAKTFIYAFLYGSGPENIGNLVGVTEDELQRFGKNNAVIARLIKQGRNPDPATVAAIVKGQRLMQSFMKRTPALAKLREKVGELFKATKTLPGLDGRVLYCRSEHSALNTLLQSAGALICKRWMVELHRALKAKGWRNGVDFMQHAWVHDEIQMSVRPEIADEVREIAIDCVRRAGEYFNFRCPLTGDGKKGHSWADTH